ncbi:hypothetical protein [Lutibacter sp.]
MKITKIAFLFLYISIAGVIFSCNNHKEVSTKKKVAIDSLSYFMQKMRQVDSSSANQLLYVDSALVIANKVQLKIKVGELLKYKSHLEVKSYKYQEAIGTSKKLLKLISSSDSLTLASQFMRIGYNYYMLSKKDSAYPYFDKSKNIFLSLKDSANTGRVMSYMAIILSDYGNYIESDQYAVDALNYIKSSDKYYLTSVYNCLAISAKLREDYLDAIYWYDKAIKESKSNKDKITYLSNKANALRYLNNYKESVLLLDSLSKDTYVKNNPKINAKVTDNLAFNTWLFKPKENVLPKLLSALHIRLTLDDKNGLNASYAHLTEYFSVKNKQVANKFATKMYDNAVQLKNPNYQLDALQKIIENNRSDNLKKYYLKYIHLRDSIAHIDFSKKNHFAKLQYDSAKNREENLLLKVSSSEKELSIVKEKNKNVIIFAISGSTIIFLLFLAYKRKQQHQIEKRTDIYKTEQRIAKKVHDEVANNVVNIMNNIQYTDKSTYNLLDDLEKVYLLTRDISRENNSIETGENFENYLKSMINSFSNIDVTLILNGFYNVQLSNLTSIKQIELYRILQELLINMKNHSKASLVAITFKKEGTTYFIKYSDNGVGVDLKNINFKSGLKNMETRIDAISGTINFETSPNNGFKAFISFKS